MLEAALPTKANLMRCHMVFTVKLLADLKIEICKYGNTQRYGVDFRQIISTFAKPSTLCVACYRCYTRFQLYLAFDDISE